MIQPRGNRYFDISAILTLGLAAFLLVSLPGGCWSDDEQADGTEDEDDVEAVAEPSPVPTMEIVDPEPGDIETGSDQEDEGEGEPEGESEPEGEAEPESDDAEPEGSGEEPDEQEQDSAPGDGTYVVQEGDTLYDIAVEFGITMEELMAENGIEDPDGLQVGQELQIP